MTDRLSSAVETVKLYYEDSHLFSFEATVAGVYLKGDGTFPEGLYPEGSSAAIEPDRTAFFPEGGGQASDTGRMGPFRVVHVSEESGRILHFVDSSGLSDLPEPGNVLECEVDREQRLNRMQNHSGEHIVSGLVNSAFGYENVGFHMDRGFMTIDFSGELTQEQLEEIETRANGAVRANLPVRAYFPSPEELKNLDYRSKLDLTENVRIVEIEGIDRCACCAPHVSRTGEVGIIKILSAERHRGGSRVTLTCGMDALDNFRRRQNSAGEISQMLSVPRDDISDAVRRLAEERDRLKFERAGLETELVRLQAAGYPEMTDGNIVIFCGYSEPACRELVNCLVPKCSGMVGVFFDAQPVSQEKEPASAPVYRYIIGSGTVDLRKQAREINSAINGRGGGKPGMIMGSASASEEVIRSFFGDMA